MARETSKISQDDMRQDLEKRTKQFAIDVRMFVKKVPRSISNIEDCKQVVRSSGSVGANYIEANEALSKKDLIMRIKISKKEAKESAYWLEIIDSFDQQDIKKSQERLIDEARQLMLIFGSILSKLSP